MRRWKESEKKRRGEGGRKVRRREGEKVSVQAGRRKVTAASSSFIILVKPCLLLYLILVKPCLLYLILDQQQVKMIKQTTLKVHPKWRVWAVSAES